MTKRNHGFSLVELLVAIGIVAILLGLVLKGVQSFRQKAWQADTQNELMVISQSIQTYYSQFHAYPGPLPNSLIGSAISITVANDATNQFYTTGSGVPILKMTGTENLVLGLCGGLNVVPATGVIYYDPTLVGQGPRSLNPLSPKVYQPFLEDSKLLNWTMTGGKKWGHYSDDVAEADDSIIPEFVDRFPQPMPILFLRANNGAAVGYTATSVPAISNTVNGVVIPSYPVAPNPPSQYELTQIIGYTGAHTGAWPTMTLDPTSVTVMTPPSSGKSIGEQKHVIKGQQYAQGTTVANTGNLYHGLRTVVSPLASMDKGTSNYMYPYDAYPYLKHPTITDSPRQKDQFILISPGPDRIYGTEDDITTFGSVGGD